VKAFVLIVFVFVPGVPPVVKRLPEHVQVDNPEVLKKLAKKLERQQVGTCLRLLSGCPQNHTNIHRVVGRHPKRVASKTTRTIDPGTRYDFT
jgi:hypothetical protein